MKPITFAWRAIGVGVLVLLGATTSACKQQTPDEQIKTYNERLGSQGEFTGTHLIVRWPAFPHVQNVPAVTLRIPREFLDNPPVAKNDDGGIGWVYVKFGLPGVTPWEPMPVSKSDSPEQSAAAAAHRRNRVLVILSRDGGTTFAVRRRIREEGHDSTRFRRDGEVGGLERYSRLSCLGPGSTPEHRHFINGKEPDDPSPPNCRLDRRSPLLVSPPEVKGDHEGVAIRCDSSSCDASFLAAQRGGRIHIRFEDLSRWREFVEPARKLVDGFIVSQ